MKPGVMPYREPSITRSKDARGWRAATSGAVPTSAMRSFSTTIEASASTRSFASAVSRNSRCSMRVRMECMMVEEDAPAQALGVFQLELDEHEFEVVGVDDVVL